jgi:hypothetical protein
LECILDLCVKHQKDAPHVSIFSIDQYLKKQDDRNEFSFMEEKKSNRWIGERLRKLGVINGGSAPQRIGHGNPVRCFDIDPHIVEKRLLALGWQKPP